MQIRLAVATPSPRRSFGWWRRAHLGVWRGGSDELFDEGLKDLLGVAVVQAELFNMESGIYMEFCFIVSFFFFFLFFFFLLVFFFFFFFFFLVYYIYFKNIPLGFSALEIFREWVKNCWWGWQNRTALEKCTHLYEEIQKNDEDFRLCLIVPCISSYKLIHFPRSVLSWFFPPLSLFAFCLFLFLMFLCLLLFFSSIFDYYFLRPFLVFIAKINSFKTHFFSCSVTDCSTANIA